MLLTYVDLKREAEALAKSKASLNNSSCGRWRKSRLHESLDDRSFRLSLIARRRVRLSTTCTVNSDRVRAVAVAVNEHKEKPSAENYRWKFLKSARRWVL